MPEECIPSYITKQLLSDALRSAFKTKSVEISKYFSEAAVPIGDSYASTLHRVLVSYSIDDKQHSHENNKSKTISVLVKSQPSAGGSADAIQTAWKMYPNEIKMFADTLKKLHKVLGPGESLSSRCLIATNNPRAVLVLEDLKPQGFKMAPRQNGIDLDHCKMAMKKIAILHAASIIMIEKDPTTKDYYEGRGIYFENPLVRTWIGKGLEAMIEACKKCPKNEKYVKKLEYLGEIIIDRGLKAGEKDPNEFNVLNHGDCWTNNILFSYDKNGKVKDIRFVDFQLVTYKSPVVDLHYFMATSPTVEIRKNHVDTLLNTYYESLINELRKLNHNLENIPTIQELKGTFQKKAAYGLISAVTVLPLVRSSSRSDATLENFIEDDSKTGFRYHCFNNDRFLSMMEYQLEYFDQMGILDP